MTGLYRTVSTFALCHAKFTLLIWRGTRTYLTVTLKEQKPGFQTSRLEIDLIELNTTMTLYTILVLCYNHTHLYSMSHKTYIYIYITHDSVFYPNGRVLTVHGRTKGRVGLCVIYVSKLFHNVKATVTRFVKREPNIYNLG